MHGQAFPLILETKACDLNELFDLFEIVALGFGILFAKYLRQSR